jgi:hypothetical protein
MHRLDSHINDIEPRIKAIFENAPKQEEASLQQSLASYGWILLDSWVAWRTLRYLLKETYIDDKVNEKWFQTPSSYTASQLKAIWKFTEKTFEYISTITGKNFRDLVDMTIQGKRNSSAHFTKRSEVSGVDSQEIKNIFQALSKVFLLYETDSFLKIVCDKLSNNGYINFIISYSDDENYNIEQFTDSINIYARSSEFLLKYFDDKNREYRVFFHKDGCKAGCKNEESEEFSLKNVVNNEQAKYDFFGNKGFYQNIDLFVSTIEVCRKKENKVS